jgi:hypothetical protein
MKLWVLVQEDHYRKYCERHALSQSEESFRIFLKDIGTPSLSFQPRTEAPESNYLSYKEAPQGSCVRLRLQGDYVGIVHKKLFQALCEKSDKSQRGTSCSIV